MKLETLLMQITALTKMIYNPGDLMKQVFLPLHKNLICKYIIVSIAVICLIVSNYAVAFATVNDVATEKIMVRKPADEKIKSFRNQRDFSYAKSLQPVDNIWEKFWRWVGNTIQDLLAKTSYNYFWKPLFYVVLIATVIFVVMKLFGVEIRSLFTKAPAAVTVPYDVVEENIHELNLDDLISQAAERKNYRLAVRYLYLKILKQLNDNGNIDWRSGKTNRMYAAELNKSELFRPFEYLTTQFEYVWYGEFEVNDVSFRQVEEKFIDFGKGISN